MLKHFIKGNIEQYEKVTNDLSFNKENYYTEFSTYKLPEQLRQHI